MSAQNHARLVVSAALVASTALFAAPRQERPAAGQTFSFRTGVDLVNVTVTVTDANGRFVAGLKREDFVVYEDGKPQPVSQFDSDRVPVSLGIALDTSGSMAGEKMVAAQAALNRFLFDLLGPEDEIFLYRFSGTPQLVQGWTTNRSTLSRGLGSVQPFGGTAMYDTVAEAIPMAQGGSQRKKALIVISDGNDTSSHTGVAEVKQLIRQSEVLVYAIGIDGGGSGGPAPTSSSRPQPPAAIPVPSPFPGKKPVTPSPQPSAPPASRNSRTPSGDRVNADALRQITDDSGGRTEIIVSNRDLDPATAGIADELSKQYFLGYVSSVPKDGRWHAIEVQVRKGNYLVRARRGFIAG